MMYEYIFVYIVLPLIIIIKIKSKCGGETPVIMLISTALLLDSNIRNSVCTPAKLPCRRVEVGYKNKKKLIFLSKTFLPYFFHVHLNILDKVGSSLYAIFGTLYILIREGKPLYPF
jgi:hypothetical protein